MVWFQWWAGGGSELTQRLSSLSPAFQTGSARARFPQSHWRQSFGSEFKMWKSGKKCTCVRFGRLCKNPESESLFLCYSLNSYLREIFPDSECRVVPPSPHSCCTECRPLLCTCQVLVQCTETASLSFVILQGMSSLRPGCVISRASFLTLCPVYKSGSDSGIPIPNTVFRNISKTINVSTNDWMLAR